MRTETIIKSIYQFSELSDDAKEQARNWWRGCENQDSSNSEYVYEDAERLGLLLGIEINQRQIPLMNGNTRSEPTIYYSGFSSQGDGACFEGSYSYAKGAAKAIERETGGTETELIRIAKELQGIQRRYFYQLSATTKQSGIYYHANSMGVDLDESPFAFESNDYIDVEDQITELLRDFANWIYRRLESEYNFTMSNENVDECININEYEFDESGNIH